MAVVAELEAQLHAAFAQVTVAGAIAPHECADCDAIRRSLRGATWADVPSAFVAENSDSLPLLSQDAYVAFLPAWLREGIRSPTGDVATMLLVKLGMEPQTHGFTSEQAHVIVQVAEHITRHNGWASEDPVNAESLAAIKQAWLP
jgi:hypothetical protein